MDLQRGWRQGVSSEAAGWDGRLTEELGADEGPAAEQAVCVVGGAGDRTAQGWGPSPAPCPLAPHREVR